MQERKFFPGAPMHKIISRYEELVLKTNLLRAYIRDAQKKFDLTIGQGNRPDRLHVQLIENGALSPFDYFFTGSRFSFEHVAKNWIEREVLEELDEQYPYIWDSPLTWKKFWELLEQNKEKKILLITSAPRKEHSKLVDFPNVLFASPTAEIASPFEFDKRIMSELYQSLGMSYTALGYESAQDVSKGYAFHSQELKGTELVIQATQGSGGVTMKSSIRALFFVENETEFQDALRALEGEGPVRIMKKYEGVGSNSAALALPFGTFISGIPTVKPCHGFPEIGVKPGTSPGNQWDERFPGWTIESQFEQLGKVGRKMANDGYNGVFGLDPVMPLDPIRNGHVFNSEINARNQGPDPQRAFAINQIGLCSIEEMQLAYYLGCPVEYFPNVHDYNLITRWLRIPGYLKLFARVDHTVRRNLNGYYRFENDEMKVVSKEDAQFKITGAPAPCQKITVASPDNFLYVKFLDPNFKIFTEHATPELTREAKIITETIYTLV